MDSIKSKMLVLFSNTFPYGKGETFLADELPFVASEFERVVIIPLFKGTSSANSNGITIELPANVEVEAPLLDFEDKDRRSLLDAGLLGLFPFTWKRVKGFSRKEFWNRALLGQNIPLLSGQKKASLRKRIWIYFNYLCIYRAILANKQRWKSIVSCCGLADIVYFYWGDKTALIAPELKKDVAKVCSNVPKFCARLHGSDLYEGAKGYLPHREEIYGALDFAAIDSEHGCSYIKDNYKVQPKEVRACFMGSIKPACEENSAIACDGLPDGKGGIIPTRGCNGVLKLVSCSNVIELKRVDLIFRSITTILDTPELYSRLTDAGYSKIEWTHFGSGNLMEDLQSTVIDYFASNGNAYNSASSPNQYGNDYAYENSIENKELKDFNQKIFRCDSEKLKISLMGQTAHSKVLKYYERISGDLFLLLSRTEGVPISLMEAMSFSIPIIATAVGGVPEIFKNHLRDAENSFVQHVINEQNNSNDREGFVKKKIGYLMNSSPSNQDVVDAILDYSALSQVAKNEMRVAAMEQWEKYWDGAKNYSNFAQLLVSLID